jgi:predicted glycoside hydrolase/deacetylase ChbG (UPF0249 family)
VAFADDCSLLADANGYFFPSTQAIRAAAGSILNLAEIEKELRAQIELGKKMVPQVSYMSTHMGFDSLSPEVRALVQKLSKEYHLVMAGAELGTQSMGRVWNATDTAEVRADARYPAGTAQPGTWLWVEHCATDTPGQAMGGTWLSIAAAWWRRSDPKVLAAVKKYGIKLTSYKELVSRQ